MIPSRLNPRAPDVSPLTATPPRSMPPSASSRSRSSPDGGPPSAPDPGSFLPLTPAVFHVLLALADGERHGYAIMQSVSETTGGEVTLGPGTLYGTLKRLLDAGLVEEHDERPDPALDDERRRYYRLTALGHRVASAESRRLETLVRAARRRGLLDLPASV